MSDAWHSMKIKQVELVGIGASGALLRVSGSAPRRKGAGARRPELVVTGADGAESVFQALPAPSDDRGVLRAAYSVPATALGEGTRFVLRLEDGAQAQLPTPTRGASLPGPPAPPAPAVPQPPAAAAPSDPESMQRARADAAEQRAAIAEARALAAEQQTAAAEAR
ncbi:MAG: hypothetical protein ACYC0H_14885, partial [Solirubrobacteraceae bacterium]